MLAYTFYEGDGRVMRYAEALAQRGVQVDAIALRRPGQPREEVLRGVRVIRCQLREKNERGKWSHLVRLLRFFVVSMVVLGRRHREQPYDLVHVHSVPDFEVFAAWLPKLAGARLILDIHDIVPELYAAKFGLGAGSPAFRMLVWMERWSAAFADHLIVANDLWRDRLVQRTAPAHKCTALINYPDLTVFRPGLRRRAADGRFIVCYPGSLNWHQGLDLAITAFAAAVREAPAMEFHIHGEGPAKPALERQIATLGLAGKVHLHPPVPQHEIVRLMADADLGVVPKRNDAFGGDAFSTKVLEFMALGVPLVVARTRVDNHYFAPTMLRFFAPGDPNALAEALLDAYRQPARSAALAAQAQAMVQQQQNWGQRQAEYLALVDGLMQGMADEAR
jgi:glycosyltransferase involved in cell wall biosynthesis